MVQDTAQRWNRTEGVLIAPGTQPDAVADRLVADRVVARLEWYPSSPHLLSVTLMADADGRVAVTPPARGGVVAGLGVSELAESLAREFGADVTIGPAAFNALPDDVVLPEVPGGPGPTTRTLVVSPLSAYMVPLQATLLERPLAVASLPGLDRRIVMYAGEGTGLGSFGWDEESLPALVLTVDEHDVAARAILTGESEDDAVFSWGMTSRYVWGGVEEPGPALRALVDELLTDSTDASVIASTVPGADVEAAAAEVPGAVVHEPRGLSNAVGRSVGMLLQDPSTPGSAFWQSYVRTVTDMPWAVRGAAILEAGLGGALVGAAVRRHHRTGRLPGGLLGVGIVLMVDAVAETSLASWTRHRELRRRADEEMALVAEELGA